MINLVTKSERTFSKTCAAAADYLYNGKELQEELGLNWLSFGFREYDPVIARFPSVDPIADQFAHVSGFNYAENEPVGHVDLWGLQQGNPPTPSAAGILYEAYVNLDAAVFNFIMRSAELHNVRKPGIITRKEVQYGDHGEILGPNKVVEKPIHSTSQEMKEIGYDLLSFTMLFGFEKNASGPFLATKTPSSIIPAIAKQFDNLQCVECANAIADALKKEGISGQIIEYQALTKNGNIDSDIRIMSKTHGYNESIGNSGFHRGVLIEGTVYDNIHKNGISYEKWLKDLDHFEPEGGINIEVLENF